MSRISVADLGERARARLGRTYQVTALAPYPARPAQHLWSFTRRGFVHGAGDLDAGFGFGGDSNLLRRLKNGLAAEGADQATLDSLTERDVTTDARGVTARAPALARLPAALREKIASPTRPPKMQNWFFEKRPAQKLRALELTARLEEYEDAGTGGVQELYFSATDAGNPGVLASTIAPPVRITGISVALSMSLALGGSYEWSVSPPGVGESMGSSVGGAAAPRSASADTGPIVITCDVPVINAAVLLRAAARLGGAGDQFIALIAVAYRRLRLKATGTL